MRGKCSFERTDCEAKGNQLPRACLLQTLQARLHSARDASCCQRQSRRAAGTPRRVTHVHQLRSSCTVAASLPGKRKSATQPPRTALPHKHAVGHRGAACSARFPTHASRFQRALDDAGAQRPSAAVLAPREPVHTRATSSQRCACLCRRRAGPEAAAPHGRGAHLCAARRMPFLQQHKLRTPQSRSRAQTCKVRRKRTAKRRAAAENTPAHLRYMITTRAAAGTRRRVPELCPLLAAEGREGARIRFRVRERGIFTERTCSAGSESQGLRAHLAAAASTMPLLPPPPR